MVMEIEWEISNCDSKQFLASGKFPVLFSIFIFVHSQAGYSIPTRNKKNYRWSSINWVDCRSFPTSSSPHPDTFSFFCKFLLLQIPSAYSVFALCSALLCFGVAEMAEAVGTGAAANIISEVCKCVIGPLVQLIKDVIHLDRNTRLLQEKLETARAFLADTDNRFRHQQTCAPAAVTDGLQRLRESLEHAERIKNRSQQRQGCLDRSFCKPRLCRQIRTCSIDIEERCIHLRSVISTGCETQEIASSAPLQAGALLQTVPTSGYVGSGIISAEKQLNTWLEDAQFGVIGVFGMGGIGKTSLLKKVYNSHKEGKSFEKVIWLVVSEKFDIMELQSVISKAIGLNLEISSSNVESSSGSSAVLDMRKTRLYNYLKEKKFLLVLDDVWKPIQLEEELGIPFGNDKGSKVVISTRSRDVINGMKADDYSIAIQRLSTDEGWQLFCREAFKAGSAPTEKIEYVARQIAEECKGLPLAINVVAAAMRGNTTADEWHLALTQMKTVDPNFLTYRGIDEDLYGRLKWSYDRLNDCKIPNLQNCFLYCGAFSEDAIIEVERLVEMWIGEGMVNSRDKRQLMDEGSRYVKQLVERCLFEYVDDDEEEIKVHDIVRDMALYIAEKEGKCLFRTSQKLDEFPLEQVMDDCKRIAIRYYNDTAFLPTDLRCPELRTLILAQNEGLRKVPNDFLLNLTSLRVLDLSYTSITSLPDSMWQLKQLQFVDLSYTRIASLPADICNLSRLQFLHLKHCKELESLPCTIEKLKNLKHLDLNGCDRLAGIPGEISQLTSLNKLELLSSNQLTSLLVGVDEAKSGMCSLKDFTNFPNLMELRVRVKPGRKVDGIRWGIKLGIMGTWLEMKHLLLSFDAHSMDDVMEDLPPDMQNMKNLHSFYLNFYGGISLPNCICDFERLEVLYLLGCSQLQELPPLERLPVLRVLTLNELSQVRELGIRGSVGGFRMLERLTLYWMPMLESISNVVWTEATLPKLQSVYIEGCRALKRLPIGIEKLSNLKDIEIEEDVWERSLAADKNIKICLEKRVIL